MWEVVSAVSSALLDSLGFELVIFLYLLFFYSVLPVVWLQQLWQTFALHSF